jgi:hypothetical protein
MSFSLLVGCALRRQELAQLEVEKIQMRERRWMIADLRGKGVGFAPWPFRYGSSKQSIFGRLPPMAKKAGYCVRSLKAARSKENTDRLVSLVRCRAVGKGDWDRSLWCPRSQANLREAMP